MHREGEVAFPGAEVDDAKRTIAGEIAGDIVDHLDEAIDLTELMVLGSEDFACAIHNSDLDQKRDHFAFGEEVGFFAVVVEGREGIGFEAGLGALDAAGTVGRTMELEVLGTGEEVEVFEVLLPDVPDFGGSLRFGEVAVEFLFVSPASRNGTKPLKNWVSPKPSKSVRTREILIRKTDVTISSAGFRPTPDSPWDLPG